MGLGGLLQGLAKTAFKEQAHRVLKNRGRLIMLPTFAIFAGALRQAKGQRQGAQYAVERKNKGCEGDNKQIQRDFSAVRRHHQQHVAVVIARPQCNGDSQRKQRQ